MQTTGCMPASARPAANVTACCSQMPTSKKRSGNSLAKLRSPVDDAIAAVMATTSGRLVAAVIRASPNTSVYVSSVDRGRLVSDGRPVPMSLLGDHVHNCWGTQTLGPREHLFERDLVMAVDDPRVLDAESFKNRRWLKELLEAFFDPIRSLVGGRPDQRHVAEQA